MPTPTELGRRLQEARKRVRLSQTAVAGELDVTRQVVSAYESGRRAVSAQELELLCNLFRVYPNNLLGFARQPPRPVAASLETRMDQGKFALSERDSEEVQDFLQRRIEQAEDYLRHWKAARPRYAPVAKSPFGSIQQTAERVRIGLGQNEPPINVFLLANQLGILVHPTFLDKAAAIVNREDEGSQPPRPPWILVNSTQPVERQRYSIAHEIAHLLLHEGERVIEHPHLYMRHFDQKEIEAESFAAELLMPRALLEESIKKVDTKKPLEMGVFTLAYLYQVSFTAMSVRLYNLNVITRTAYDQLAKVKPSTLESTLVKHEGRRPFRPEKFVPTLEAELGVKPRPSDFTADAVRKMQEMAYTRYVGQETQGGEKHSALYSLDPPNKVYERVALWIAKKYPMESTAPC
jgi:Zn-dependent peptidase ImmA (M78 family)/transcriptional regulator with XRE-family HTH domain